MGGRLPTRMPVANIPPCGGGYPEDRYTPLSGGVPTPLPNALSIPLSSGVKPGGYPHQKIHQNIYELARHLLVAICRVSHGLA